MAGPSQWGMTPRQSVENECRTRGHSAVVTGCLDLLAGTEVDPSLIYALGGPPARWAVTGGEGGPDYWLRVWAARGLLWAWEDSATPAIQKALSDPAWRVREMALRVAGRHRLDGLLSTVQERCDDVNHRVRAAADQAAGRILAAES